MSGELKGDGGAALIEYHFSDGQGFRQVLLYPDRGIRCLVRSGVVQGVQNTDSATKGLPLAYYSSGSPFADALDALDLLDQPSVGVIGLGVGTMAAFARPGWTLTFYEIDEIVIEVARNPAWFTFLSDCEGTVRIVPGDAIDTVALEPEGSFDVLVLDAFVGRIPPRHLVELGALAMYTSRLKPDGALLFNLSGGRPELLGFVADWAADKGLTCLWRNHEVGTVPSDTPGKEGPGLSDKERGIFSSRYLAVGAKQTLRKLSGRAEWFDAQLTRFRL
jgi:hypothetical protein